jgi:hypothetical protein
MVCGRFSQNGRAYTAECLREAAGLLDGMKVRCNHPRNPADTRPTEDTLGWLTNVRQNPKDQALYADFHILLAHPMSRQVIEAAQRRPDLFALSWNCDGTFGGQDEQGRDVIIAVEMIRGVDLVDCGATNKSLFEGLFMPTIRQIIARRVRSPRMRRALREAADDAHIGGATPVMEPDDEAGNGGGWRQCLADAIGKCVSSGDPEAHDVALKLMRMLRPDEGDEDVEEEEVPAPPPGKGRDDDLGDDEDDQGHPRRMESRRPRRAAHDAKSFLDAIQDDDGGGRKPFASRRPRRVARDSQSLAEAITGKPLAKDVKAFIDAITEGF